MSLSVACTDLPKMAEACMVVFMQEELTPADRKLITQLAIITQEVAIAENEIALKKAHKKALVIDLVRREILSQARASRIAEVQRQTVTNWVNTWPGEETGSE